MEAPAISIVVVSFNTRALLERCLESVERDSPGLAREVIVVDNGSGDGSPDRVAARWPETRLVRNPANVGYAPACNQGLRAARGRQVMALNSDAFLDGGTLERCVRWLDAHPDVAALGPRLLNQDGSVQWGCARRDPTFVGVLLTHTPLPGRFPQLLPLVRRYYSPDSYQGTHDVEVLSGACIVFRREALERYGALDDRLVLNYDDVEWSLRARRLGARIVYFHDASVVHLGGQSRHFLPETTNLAQVRSAFAFADLRYGPVGALPLKAVVLGEVVLSLAKNLVLSPFSAARRTKAAMLGDVLRSGVALMARAAGSERPRG
jgi:GT2 family glycosyltransferase